MTSAAAMISGGTTMAVGQGGEGAGTGTRPPAKDGRASLSVATRSLSGSPASTSLSCSSSPTLPLAGLLMHEPDRPRTRPGTGAGGSGRRHVKDFNDSITCTLCSGYLVEATTVNDCLHTFCRSCIVKYLESNKYCPRCKSYNSKPITAANLRPDRTLRALVYKLVPGLHKSENQRMVNFYAEISSSNNVPFGDDQHLTHGALSLLDDQNFFSPDEPISLSLEYHYDTLGEQSASAAKVRVTYLQCPAAVTVHHLDKFILTKNGLLVGADHIRVEIIYEDEVLPPDFTLMDVAYCFGYKRIAPMRFFYRILIHSTAKPAPTASTYHRVEGQDKNSTGRSGGASAPSHHAIGSPTPTGQRQGEQRQHQQQQQQHQQHQQQQQQANAKEGPLKAAAVRPRTQDANNSPAGVVTGAGSKENTARNGVHPSTSVEAANRTAVGKSSAALATATVEKLPPPSSAPGTVGSERKPQPSGGQVTAATATKKQQSAASALKMVLTVAPPKPATPKATDTERNAPQVKTSSDKPATGAARPADKGPTNGNTVDERPTEPKPLKVVPTAAPVAVASEKPPASPSTTSELKCYVNLKKQTVVGGATATPATKQPQPQQQPQQQQPPQSPSLVEIPRLKIDLPRLKTKLSVPGERRTAQGSSPPSSSSSSAATSPASAASSSGGTSSSSGKSPVWPMGKEEYAKTIGLKPVYAVLAGDEGKQSEVDPGSSSHRKRKKGKHSKEAGGSGKRRKLHAEISSQHDASLKMKVKLTEKPPKHERLKSSGNEEEPQAQSTPPQAPVQVASTPASPPPPPQPKPATSPPVVAKSPPQESVPGSSMPKVIDITKDDDDVKFVNHERPSAAPAKLPARKSPTLEPVPAAAVQVAPAAVPVSTPTTTTPTSSKDKLSEMRAIRHKPMVYIPNLDRSLSADSSISSFIESVQATKAPAPPAVASPRPTITTTAAGPASVVSSAMLKPTPALIPASTASTMAGKSQPRTPILSPRTMQSYPPLAYPLTSSTTASSASSSIRTMAPPGPMKRSISTDGGGTGPSQHPKLARLEPPSLVAPSSPHPAVNNANTNSGKQPIHAPMFNFAKGANRAKAAQQAATGNGQPADVPYRSPISSTYTKEMVTKKPIPNLLLPPASISVTKMPDMVSSSTSSSSSSSTSTLSSSSLTTGSGSSSSSVDHRPALEIVRIPSNAPVADKPSLAPFTKPPPKLAPAGGHTPKTTRPPPATIPLIKIKKPITPGMDGAGTVSSSGTAASSPPGMTPLAGAAMRPKMASSGPGQSIMDLTGPRRLSDEVIILDPSPVKKGNASSLETGGKSRALDRDLERLAAAASATAANRRNSIPGLKLPPDMIGFPISTPVTSAVSSSSSSPLLTPSGGQKTLAPLPKLTEINRNRNLAVRQPNASIRSIPNPSALAFRGAQPSPVTPPVTSSSGGISVHSSSTSGITSSTMGLVGRTNGNPTSGSMTNAFKNVSAGSSTSPLSNGSPSARAQATGLNGNSSDVNSSSASASSNNNNVKLLNANTSTPGGGKKTIENVAAVLKAAAATVETSTNRTPTSTSSSSTAASAGSGNSSSTIALDGRKKSSSGGGNSSPSRTTASTAPNGTTTSSSSTPTTMAAVTATPMNGGVTSVTAVSTSTMASVTAANGSARSSPASIVNVI